MPTAPRKKAKRTSISDPVFSGFKVVEALTDNQGVMADDYRRGKNVIAVGSAGTGKTFMALALALESLIKGEIKRIVIVRSSVSTRDIGFLPGDEHQKMEAFEGPYKAIVNELLGRGDAYGLLKAKDAIRFESTSFLRGSTWHDTAVIADEVQNFTAHEINTLMTRMGRNARVVVVGDLVQSDLEEGSGFDFLMKVVEKMKADFGIIRMTHADIVRSPFVKAWIIACEKYTNFYKRGHG